ncbi:MAG TPA: tRNA (uridine(34)/cytosine(34)/5-carboxymethylaminomethyluridine(34)-2'-O)-methyltransferase TrmL [Elusimicrobia bacterium]|nr:tRNA (uridine(34)/cytosine(34)/5-carboxymethylaminomethyluridine(34)-2'-O)-methyltransferase TrmL [Elusimicrobiota bacterium]
MNVVLLEPEIHFNTGNIGRTCVGTGTVLHLVGKLGFSLDSTQIRRSGLDYWARLDLRMHKDLDAFLGSVPARSPLLFFSAEAGKEHWDAPYAADCYMVFGKESVGLPPELRERYRDDLYRVRHSPDIRSLNLSACVAVVLYEAVRQTSR